MLEIINFFTNGSLDASIRPLPPGNNCWMKGTFWSGGFPTRNSWRAPSAPLSIHPRTGSSFPTYTGRIEGQGVSRPGYWYRRGGKKGEPKLSPSRKDGRRSTLTGTNSEWYYFRVPSASVVSPDFHFFAALNSTVRFHADKGGHSDFNLKLYADVGIAVSVHISY